MTYYSFCITVPFTVSVLLINLVKTALFMCCLRTPGTRHQKDCSFKARNANPTLLFTCLEFFTRLWFLLDFVAQDELHASTCPPSAFQQHLEHLQQHPALPYPGASFCQTSSVTTTLVSWQQGLL